MKYMKSIRLKFNPILCFGLLLALVMNVHAAPSRYFVIADHPIDTQGRLLEFGNPDYHSCLVPIFETNDIAYARLLYQRHNPSRYPDAETLLGPDPRPYCELELQPFQTCNRNYMAPGSSPWNWTVSRFRAFGWWGWVGSMPLNFIIPNVNDMDQIDTVFEQVAKEYSAVFNVSYEVLGELPIQPTVFMPNGWKKSDWLGVYYDASYPWVYSEELGWLYLIPGKFDPFDIWMYVAHDGIGWVWTSETAYPQAWHPGQNNWINLPDLVD